MGSLQGSPSESLQGWPSGSPQEWPLGSLQGVASGVATGVAFGVAAGVFLVLAAGVARGVAAGVAYGVAIGVAVREAFGVARGVAAAIFISVAFGLIEEVTFGVAVGVGVLRLPMYLIHSGGLVRPSWRRQNPIWWDELAVLPFLQTQVAINQAWQHGDIHGLQKLAQLAANPFQRWVLQQALYLRLHQPASAIPFLYQVLSLESLEAPEKSPGQ